MYRHVYDSFKYLYDKGGVIYIISDPHFSDEEMYKLRGVPLIRVGKSLYKVTHFPDDKDKELKAEPTTFEALDMEQVKKINSRVGKNDVIIFLGDIGNIEPVKKIRGYKILIMGNHEQGASNYKRVVELKQFNYDDSDNETTFKLEEEAIKQGFKLEGYTQFADHLEKRYSLDNHLFDEVYEGPLMINDRVILSHEPIMGLPDYMFNIHGHTHSNKIEDDHHLNVCMEVVGGVPVNFTRIIKDGLLKNISSIHQTTIEKATAKKQKRLAQNKK